MISLRYISKRVLSVLLSLLIVTAAAVPVCADVVRRYHAGDIVTAVVSFGGIELDGDKAKLGAYDYTITYNEDTLKFIQKIELIEGAYVITNNDLKNAVNIAAMAANGLDEDLTGEKKPVIALRFEVTKDTSNLDLSGVCLSLTALTSDSKRAAVIYDYTFKNVTDTFTSMDYSVECTHITEGADGAYKYHAGDIVTANVCFEGISVDGAPALLGAYNYNLYFDPDALYFDSFENKATGSSTDIYADVPGMIFVGMISADGAGEDFTTSPRAACSLSFVVKKNTDTITISGECPSLSAITADRKRSVRLVGDENAGGDTRFCSLTLTTDCPHSGECFTEDSQFHKDDIVTVEVKLGALAIISAEKLASISYELSFAPSALELVSEKFDEGGTSGTNVLGSVIRLGGFSEDGFSTDYTGAPQTFCTLTFRCTMDTTAIDPSGKCTALSALTSDDVLVALIDGTKTNDIFTILAIQKDCPHNNSTVDTDTAAPITTSDTDKFTDAEIADPITTTDIDIFTDTDTASTTTDSDFSVNTDTAAPITTDSDFSVNTDTAAPETTTDSEISVNTDTTALVTTDSEISVNTDTTALVTTDSEISVNTDTAAPETTTDSEISVNTDTTAPVTTDSEISVNTDTTAPATTTDSEISVNTDTTMPVTTTDSEISVNTDTTAPATTTDSEISDNTDTAASATTDSEISVNTDTTAPATTTDSEISVNTDTDSEVVVDNVGYKLLNDDTAVVTQIIGEEKEVVIPRTIDGRRVTRIDANAFRNNTFVESIILSDDIIEIGEAAFEHCDKLASLIIGESVKSIAKNVFRGCPMLMMYGVKGSYAEQYAEENDIIFVNRNNLVGDVDEDGTITANDSLMVLRGSVGFFEMTKVQSVYADVNDDDKTDSSDALQILRYSVSLQSEPKVGNPIID